MKKYVPWVVLLILAMASLACSFGTNIVTMAQKPTSLPTVEVKLATAVPPPAVVTAPAGGTVIQGGDVLVGLYQRVSPGVVSIQTLSDSGGGLGSGFVFDKQGHIVTNYHVVEGATDLEVDFPSGFKTRGKTVATDLDSDLAVVKVDVPADQLVPLPLGNSDNMQVGQTVVAIGNPFGLTGTMTLGIISAKGRTLDSLRSSGDGQFFSAGDLLQTDASINPGNSGGPLVDLNGEVIGLNRAIRTTGSTTSGEPTNSGIGFAVSSKIIGRVIPVLISQGKFDYPYLGISARPQISLIEEEALGLSQSTGAYIVNVVPGGPADKAGLRGGSRPTSIQGLDGGGDLIIAVDGYPVNIFGDLLSYLMTSKSPGDTVTLTIIRDKEKKEVPLTLAKRP